MCFLCKSGFNIDHGLKVGDGTTSSGYNNNAYKTGTLDDALMLGIKYGLTALGTSATVSYTFNVPNILTINEQYKNLVASGLSKWENVANITFDYKIPSAAVNSTVNILFGIDSTLLPDGILGITYPTFTGNQYNKADIDVATENNGQFPFDIGLTIAHEIGHGIGLKHPFTDGSGLNPTLPANLDTNDYTLMSYTYGTYANQNNLPTGPMYIDIMAVQRLYGANMGANSGNTVYNYGGEKQVFTLWDGNGIDTINFNTYAGGAVIDLAGGLSNVSRIGETVFWIYKEIVENVDAGNGNDVILGNSLNNFVSARQGNDTVIVGQGDDVVWGGQGIDSIRGGKGNDVINGNIGDDTVSGDIGNDLLNGGRDQDIINGGEGNDTLSGDLGNDNLDGGSGEDTYIFNPGAGLDIVSTFEVLVLQAEI